MSTLFVQLPPRPRLVASGRAGPGAAANTAEPSDWFYVLSSDGLQATRSGRAATALLPRADRLVAVLDAQDLSWHAVALPKAPQARLRQALEGVLEEALLDEPEQVHFALPPRDERSAAKTPWVAVCDRAWLKAMVAALESGGRTVDRVLPFREPAPSAERRAGHFDTDAASDEPNHGEVRLTVSSPEGVTCWRVAQSAASTASTAFSAEAPTEWTSTPTAAAAAERWLGQPVQVVTAEQALLRAAHSEWNLRQFDLALRLRGTRTVRGVLREFGSPSLRWLRWGLAALIVVQLAGLNLMAWQQERALKSERQAMVQLLQQTHPQVRGILDAPLQMQRETERLRAAAGKPGETDFEVLLAAAAAAWPDGAAPLQTLAYDGSTLTLQAPGFAAEWVPSLRERLQPFGLTAELSEGRITLTRAAPPRRPAS